MHSKAGKLCDSHKSLLFNNLTYSDQNCHYLKPHA